MNKIFIIINYNVMGFSKNGLYGRKKNKAFLRKEAKKARQDLVDLIKQKPQPWAQTKTWLGIKVIRPNFRSDPINFIDGIADAIKEGIGVDDKWFAIEYLDWEIDKNNSKIEVTIWQENAIDVRYCPDCNTTKELINFSPAGTYCKLCQTSQNKKYRDKITPNRKRRNYV